MIYFSFISFCRQSSIRLNVIYHIFVCFSTYYLYFISLFVFYAQHLSFKTCRMLKKIVTGISLQHMTIKKKCLCHYTNISLFHPSFIFPESCFLKIPLRLLYEIRKSSENFVSASVIPCSFKKSVDRTHIMIRQYPADFFFLPALACFQQFFMYRILSCDYCFFLSDARLYPVTIFP